MEKNSLKQCYENNSLKKKCIKRYREALEFPWKLGACLKSSGTHHIYIGRVLRFKIVHNIILEFACLEERSLVLSKGISGRQGKEPARK